MFHGMKPIDELLGHPVFCRFKGGGSPDPPSSTIADTDYTKSFRNDVYPMIDNAMAGKGFGPLEVTNRLNQMRSDSIDSSYATARGELNSDLARTLQRGDSRPSDYLNQALNRQQITDKDTLRRNIQAEKIADMDTGMTMANSVLASERRMSGANVDAYNSTLQQAARNDAQYGTFGTNVAGGLGAGMTDYYFAQKMAGKA
jgi:hypothetical protein